MGRSQGTVARSRRQASGHAGGGSSGFISRFRGHHSARQLRRRHGHGVGHRNVGTRGQRVGDAGQRRSEVSSPRREAAGRVRAGAHALAASRQQGNRMVAHEAPRRQRHSWIRHRRLRLFRPDQALTRPDRQRRWLGRMEEQSPRRQRLEECLAGGHPRQGAKKEKRRGHGGRRKEETSRQASRNARYVRTYQRKEKEFLCLICVLWVEHSRRGERAAAVRNSSHAGDIGGQALR